MGTIIFFCAFWKCNKMHKLCFLCIFFFFYRNRSDVFTATHLKLLLMLLNGRGYYHSILPYWQMGVTLFSFPLSTTWHWLFEKVHALRSISGPYTMELICSLGHQHTFIFLQYIFRGPLPKRHFCTQKGSLAIEVCAALRLQSSAQTIDHSRWCCLTLCPGFWVVIEAQDLKALFAKFCLGKHRRFKLTSLFLSYSRPLFCI